MDDAAIDAELAIWESAQPPWERADPIWSLVAYRLARYALDNAKGDLRGAGLRVPADARDQLLRSSASVVANIGEGYSRPTPRDRAKFYAYAVGSAREAVAWYQSVDDRLPGGVATARIIVLTRVRRLLLGLIQRSGDARWVARPK
jgi:four helix bundle protein